MNKVKLGDVAIEYKETIKDAKEGYPIVGLEHLVSGNIILDRWDNNVDNTFTKVFRKGCVLFGRRRAYLKKAAYAGFDGICSGDITVIKAIPEKILPELLPFIIQNDFFFDYAVGKSAGSLSPRVKWEHLKNYEFYLPDLDRQAKLANLLWSMVETKNAYNDLICNTDELVKSQFSEEINYWKKQNMANEVKLGTLTNIKTGKLDANASVAGGKYPFFTCSKEISRIDSYSYDCECVLVAGNGELNAKYYNGKFDAYQRTYIIESKDKSKLLVPYIYRFMEQYLSTLQEKAIGGIIKYIKMENLTNALITVPTIDEQKRFLMIVEQSDKSKFELNRLIIELDETIKQLIENSFVFGR